MLEKILFTGERIDLILTNYGIATRVRNRSKDLHGKKAANTLIGLGQVSQPHRSTDRVRDQYSGREGKNILNDDRDSQSRTRPSMQAQGSLRKCAESR